MEGSNGNIVDNHSEKGEEGKAFFLVINRRFDFEHSHLYQKPVLGYSSQRLNHASGLFIW
jgi:hypothetical protein